jgi:hypothetical protein
MCPYAKLGLFHCQADSAVPSPPVSCGRLRLRIYLYHFPALSQVPLSPSLIHRLVKAYPRTVAGVKDSSGQWDYSQTLIQVHHTLLPKGQVVHSDRSD